MSPRDVKDDTLALAGLFQAVDLVRQVARTGHAEPLAFAASIASVFRIDAPSPEAVYGGRARLAHGLGTLAVQLDGARARQDPELTRYAASVMFLERRLAGNEAMLGRLRDAILATPGAGAPGGDVPDAGPEAGVDDGEEPATTAPAAATVAHLAEVYVTTLGAIGPRIMVSGEPAYLNDDDKAASIRALLLAAVRSAVLWRQLGGTRLRLLLLRRRIARCARELAAA